MTKKYLLPRLLYLAPLVLFLVSFIWPIGILKAQNEIKPGDVVINEVMWMGSNAHPADEWLELKNTTGKAINFSETPCSLYDVNGKKLVDINKGTISANGYFLIANRPKDFKFNNGKESALNIDPDILRNYSTSFLSNSELKIVLKNGAGDIIDAAGDGGKPLAGSYTSNQKWESMERNEPPSDGTKKESWHTATTSVNFDPGATEKGTPGAENSPPPEPLLQLPFLDPPTSSPNQKESDNEEPLLLSTIKDARQKPKDTEVLVQGIATVMPGVFSTDYFYIQDETAGIQIYFPKGDFPDIKIGSKITAVGVISESNNEKRVRLLEKGDAVILGQEKEPEPLNLKTGQINEDSEGMLVKVTGKVVEPKGNLFYLDDGSGKVKIYIDPDTKIEKPRLKEGQEIEVTGIVSQYKEPYRILPRKSEDLKTKDGKVLAQSSEGSQKSKSKTKKGTDEADEEEEIIDDTSSPEPSSQTEKVLGASSRRYNWPWWSALLGLAFLGSAGYLINDYQNQKRTGNSKIWSKVRPLLERWRNYWVKRRTGRW